MLSFAPDNRKHSRLLTQGVRGTWSSLLRCHHTTVVCSQVLCLINLPLSPPPLVSVCRPLHHPPPPVISRVILIYNKKGLP